MGTNGELNKNNRTNIESAPLESDAVWEQLLRLAEDGDIRAIKLYYEMLEKKQRPQTAACVTDTKAASEIESMAAIRRAVFGDAAMTAAAASAVRNGTAEVGGDIPDAEEEEPIF